MTTSGGVAKMLGCFPRLLANDSKKGIQIALELVELIQREYLLRGFPTLVIFDDSWRFQPYNQAYSAYLQCSQKSLILLEILLYFCAVL